MQSGAIDNYTVGKTLGEGYSAKVKLAVDEEGNQVALKIFDLTDPEISDKAVKFVKQEVDAT